jgi:hypothetical protein
MERGEPEVVVVCVVVVVSRCRSTRRGRGTAALAVAGTKRSERRTEAATRLRGMGGWKKGVSMGVLFRTPQCIITTRVKKIQQKKYLAS